jgi:hypothetical protein
MPLCCAVLCRNLRRQHHVPSMQRIRVPSEEYLRDNLLGDGLMLRAQEWHPPGEMPPPPHPSLSPTDSRGDPVAGKGAMKDVSFPFKDGEREDSAADDATDNAEDVADDAAEDAAYEVTEEDLVGKWEARIYSSR